MSERRFNARVILKHATEADWSKSSFVPEKGEIVIYDRDANCAYERVKVGDGSKTVPNLPFTDKAVRDLIDTKVDKVSGKGLSTNDYTTAEKNKLAGIAEGANKTVVDTALSTTSTNPVQNKVVKSAIDDILSNKLGGKTVSESIAEAVAGLKNEIPEQVQADMNQNDETAPDYVKNRTHYSEYTEGELFSEEVSINMGGVALEASVGLAAGLTYSIAFNGTTYEGLIGKEVLVNDTPSIAIGNLTFLEIEDETNIDLPICIYETPLYLEFGILADVVDGNYAVTVAGERETVKQIDNKYLPKAVSYLVAGETIGSLRTMHTREEDEEYKLGFGALAMGYYSEASGDYSHAEGQESMANGDFSHAEGFSIANGQNSHSEGTSTANGDFSHAEGEGTIAGSAFQHTQGKYNIEDTEDKYAHIVGNGVNTNRQSNAHTLDWDGLGWFASSVKVGGTGQDDANAKTLATEDYVDTASAAKLNDAKSYTDTAIRDIPYYKDFKFKNYISTLAGAPEDPDGSIMITADKHYDTLSFVAGNNLISFEVVDTSTLAGDTVTITVNADPVGSADAALEDAKSYTDAEIKELSDNIADSIDAVAKDLDEHTHDDKYYGKTAGEGLANTLAAVKDDVDAFFKDATISTAAKDTLKEIQEYIESDAEAAASLAAAIKRNADELVAHTGSTNPHSVTKSQVGLGNVPNVATNDQTPTYTVASTAAELTSGEKLSVAFGKIAKAVKDFISHIANKSNPHEVTYTQVGADKSGSADTALKNAKAYTDTEITELSENITGTIEAVEDNSITGLSVSGKTITYTKGDGSTGTITTQDTDTTYSAAGSDLGLVKSGGDVTISSGVITVKDDSHNHTIANVDNLQTALDGKADKSEGAFFVEGSGTTDATAKTSTWTGTCDRITEYYDGLTIRYKVGVAGQSTVTLNINNLGAKTVYRFSTTKLTTQFPVGSIIHLIYHSDLNGGCWVTNDYDANTNTYQRLYVTTTNKEYPITSRYNNTTGETYYAEYGRYSTGVTLNPSTNTITATAFKGKLTGNADTATKATQDASGNTITSTYATQSALKTVSDLVGDTKVSTQIANSLQNYYTKDQVDALELITVADIDAICGSVPDGDVPQSDINELLALLK